MLGKKWDIFHTSNTVNLNACFTTWLTTWSLKPEILLVFRIVIRVWSALLEKKKGLMEFYNGVVNGVGWLRARICHCLLSANFRIPKNRLDHFWFCGLMDKTFHIFHPKSVHYAHKLDFAICITASAFHFHAYSHPRDTMLNGTRH